MSENTATSSRDALVLALARQDLRPLTPAQLAGYLTELCQAAGIPPALMPFQLLSTRDGRTIPYITAAGAFFLARRESVSLRVIERQTVEGVHLVRAEARTPDGRVAEATGGVAIEGLRGQALADALMKAETKAFRRATLRLCGLAMLDESELDSFPDARVAPIEVAHSVSPATEPVATVITEPESGDRATRLMRRVHALANERLGSNAHDTLHVVAEAAFGAASMRKLSEAQLQQMVAWLEEVDPESVVQRVEILLEMSQSATENDLRAAADAAKELGFADDSLIKLLKRRRYHEIKAALRDGAIAAGA